MPVYTPRTAQSSRLVRIDEADLTPDVLSYLTSELGRSGWIVQHIPSGTHINWNFGWG